MFDGIFSRFFSLLCVEWVFLSFERLDLSRKVIIVCVLVSCLSVCLRWVQYVVHALVFVVCSKQNFVHFYF